MDRSADPAYVLRAGAPEDRAFVAYLRGQPDGARVLAAMRTVDGYHLYHAARADLLRRLERHAEAATAYRRALELTESEPERRFLTRRLAEISEQLPE